MKNYLWLLLSIFTILACNSKGKNNSKENALPTELKDAYPKLKLPFYTVDSTLDTKAGQATISLATFTKFFPDTIFTSTFGKDRNLKLYPLGKIDDKSRESYFVTLARGKDLSAVFLSVYDSNKHTVSLPLVVNTPNNMLNAASIDKKLTIVINKEWSEKNDIYYNRTIFAYNNVGIFTTVLTETNEQRRTEDIVSNPLDTFPKLQKFSGDYNKGKKGYLFIRDGSNPNEYLFFVNFKTDNEEDPCSGELRGKFTMISEKVGQFTNPGDPCTMDFTFKGNEVQVKENGSCGNYRDIKCFFNDTYIKKREAKPTTKKK